MDQSTTISARGAAVARIAAIAALVASEPTGVVHYARDLWSRASIVNQVELAGRLPVCGSIAGQRVLSRGEIAAESAALVRRVALA